MPAMTCRRGWTICPLREGHRGDCTGPCLHARIHRNQNGPLHPDQTPWWECIHCWERVVIHVEVPGQQSLLAASSGAGEGL